MNEIVLIQEKDSTVSYEEVQQLLHRAHQSNEKLGLHYATADQTVEKLIQKIGNGICFVARLGMNGPLIGTCTLCKIKIHYWYHSGEVFLIKLVGVDSAYKGYGIGSALIETCLHQVQKEGGEIVISDSAESNTTFRKLVYKYGFQVVDCVKYKANNFVNCVYGKWMKGNCPWSPEELKKEYDLHRAVVEQQERA